MFGDNEMNFSDSEDDDYVPLKEELKFLEDDQVEYLAKSVTQQTKNLFKLMLKEDYSTFTSKKDDYEQDKNLDEISQIKRSTEVVDQILIAENADAFANQKLLHFAGKIYKLNKEGELEEVKEDRNQQKKLLDNATKIEGKEEELNKEIDKNIENGEEDPYTIIQSQEEAYRNQLKERFDNLKSLLSLMQNKHRNVSAIWKSRIDWKKFSKLDNMEQQFNQNRKDGFINKQAFVAKTNLLKKRKL